MLLKIVIYQKISKQNVKGGVTYWSLLMLKVTNLPRKTDFPLSDYITKRKVIWIH